MISSVSTSSIASSSGTPCFDWSSVAPLQMLLWDLAVNPSYRAPMVFHFYIAFVVLAVVHQAFFLACHGNLRHWRLSRGAVLCTLLIGRGVACLPPLLPGVGKSTEHLQAATSLAGPWDDESSRGLGPAHAHPRRLDPVHAAGHCWHRVVLLRADSPLHGPVSHSAR